jgi:hypothetical protein
MNDQRIIIINKKIIKKCNGNGNWNGNLFDETVNGATIRGEIGGISIGVSKEPEQIIGEF